MNLRSIAVCATAQTVNENSLDGALDLGGCESFALTAFLSSADLGCQSRN